MKWDKPDYSTCNIFTWQFPDVKTAIKRPDYTKLHWPVISVIKISQHDCDFVWFEMYDISSYKYLVVKWQCNWVNYKSILTAVMSFHCPYVQLVMQRLIRANYQTTLNASLTKWSVVNSDTWRWKVSIKI